MDHHQKKAFEMVVEKIESDIIEKLVSPGDKLPAERVLADKLQVSRTSVREGLRKLEHDGLIEIKHGIGSFVTVKETSDLPETLFDADDHLLYEMLEFRAVLEVESAVLAAQRATSTDLDKIQKALKEMLASKEDVERGVEADVAFHMAIVEATHNSVFIHLIKSMQSHMVETIRATRKHRFVDSRRYEDTFNEHREIYLAIASKNEGRAKYLMTSHIAQIRRELSETMLEDNNKTSL